MYIPSDKTEVTEEELDTADWIHIQIEVRYNVCRTSFETARVNRIAGTGTILARVPKSWFNTLAPAITLLKPVKILLYAA